MPVAFSRFRDGGPDSSLRRADILPFNQGYVKVEGCPFVLVAVNPNFSLMVFREDAGVVQTEPRTFP